MKKNLKKQNEYKPDAEKTIIFDATQCACNENNDANSEAVLKSKEFLEENQL